MPEGRGARPPAAAAYGGYHQTRPGKSDEELTEVGPGTACGEYLRRFWQPLAMSEELKDLPLLRRILGEDLVLFRDKGGRVGLVHRNCPHRRASLEFGVCEDRGIRCCYHGWQFDVDGRILEAPGQPDGVEARLKATVALGAYPTHEYKGLIFAYLGPPEEKPAFPVYDTLEIPDQIMTPYKAPFACNWLQVLDAILDPIHTSFLHARISRQQFSEGLSALGAIKFYERPSGYLGTFTRRVGDYAWVRTNELVLPNFTQAGAALAADGTRSRYFGRTDFSRWVVPVDDEATVCYAWAMFGERADPPEYNTSEGAQLIEQGELFDRTYEERQRFPGDLEATEGMGRITEHEKENLVPSDRGIVLYRKRLRRLCRALEHGERPAQPTDLWANPVPTYGGDTVLRLPPDQADGAGDAAYLERIGQAVMEIQFQAETLAGAARDATVIERLKRLEAEGLGQ
jgi:phenylpropionate dioxygenase-like ring-hydroxylating dioxygenase large terminal subunit